MRSTLLLSAFVIAPFIGVGSARAADQPPAQKTAPTRPSDDEAAVRAAGAAFLEAYNARDAKKLAALWSPEAVYVDPADGDEVVGRAAIEEMFAAAFADKKDIKLTSDVHSIDFVSPNVAVTRAPLT
jgi:ketosteroid isomerase-like protein